MRDYFFDGEEILAYEDSKQDLSYQELYNIYKPAKYVIKECLKEQRKTLEVFNQEREKIRSRLAPVVPYADLELSVGLVTVINSKEIETLQNLIELNEGILRLIDGSYNAEEVKMISMLEFIKFKNRWARCPFHADTNPSFYYYPQQNRAHCFSGCGQKNVIQVFAQLNGISNGEAFRQLKERLA